MTDQCDTPDPGKFFAALAPTRTLSNADTPDTLAALDTTSAGGRNTDPPARPSLDDGQEDRGDSRGAVRNG